MAKACPEEKDTCGTCGGEHRHSNCNSYRTYFCVNCKSKEHGSSDKDCPDYIAQRDTLNARTPENLMPYFPTEEPWMQVSLPPKPSGPIVHSQPPPSTTHTDIAAIQQHTINWMLKCQAEKTGQPPAAPVINGRTLVPLGRKTPRCSPPKTSPDPRANTSVPPSPHETTPDQSEPRAATNEDPHLHPQPFPTISPLHFPGNLPLTPPVHNPPTQQESTSPPPSPLL
ncbi:hypothetical protein SCLCIDRAFT_1178821 [Scleroderma citrinum Foug A]|uniref:Uncharacterized protein n=1 Tax=Scleroderma citrinum Foug A TaxID=1036808 RepID=A0A0C3AAR0_9AGAM|nr:hypothetical protein SCLCIDRAFT_1178821 [Scleroderma citrinum Foug A]